MSGLEVGIVGKSEAESDSNSTALHLGSGDVEVFGSPALVALVEAAAVNCLQGKLAEGEKSVSSGINISHLAATPVGLKVRAEAKLVEKVGDKLRFEVVAYDDKEKIGQGTHERTVVKK